MPDRSRLHELVENLPEEAVSVALGALEHYQLWPPQRPPLLGGGMGAGSGSFRTGRDGLKQYGHQSHSEWEGDAVVVTTHRYHAGHELVIVERLRVDEVRRRLVYAYGVWGPGGVSSSREMEFEIG